MHIFTYIEIVLRRWGGIHYLQGATTTTTPAVPCVVSCLIFDANTREITPQTTGWRSNKRSDGRPRPPFLLYHWRHTPKLRGRLDTYYMYN